MVRGPLEVEGARAYGAERTLGDWGVRVRRVLRVKNMVRKLREWMILDRVLSVDVSVGGEGRKIKSMQLSGDAAYVKQGIVYRRRRPKTACRPDRRLQ